jgi:pimeloyl-ACP methyl ester carboxylesterase
MVPHLRVNGVDLAYIGQGTGAPVVFVHGAWMDLRYWEPQRQATATQYRFIAYTLRYHGTAPWPDAGQHYSVATHAADLMAFIRQLHAGPVHLVGLSSGGRLVTLAALEHPDLVRSLTLAEPALAELLADLPAERWRLRQATGGVPPDDPGQCADGPAPAFRPSAARDLPRHASGLENPHPGRGRRTLPTAFCFGQ